MKQQHHARAWLAVIVMVTLALLSLGGIARAVTGVHAEATPRAYLPTDVPQTIIGLPIMQRAHFMISR